MTGQQEPPVRMTGEEGLPVRMAARRLNNQDVTENAAGGL